ncbi:MAG: AGE family epimerase/isomerase, partial [Bacteroidaceae bacterium]|nr:AGE family epimerase/isomerase [Bacteroidaceae bacterium]
MKTRLIIFLSLFVFSFAKAQPTDTVNQLKKEVTTNLTDNILPFWLNYTVDPAGGFYGVVNNDGTPVADAEKGSILNARILWTFSKAYGKFGYERYRQAADRAAAYVIQHFIDTKYGGVYWSLDSEGRMKDGTKQTYALAFTIYGLAEHFRVTGDKKSLDAALSLYQTLETKVHDHQQLGYIENFQRDYTRTQTKGVDGMAGATKTMNTHIHLLEAYTTLYQVWPDEGLKANLKELLGILSDKLYDARRGHLILFCDDDWHPMGEVDSFGHDIETSWLICEAANAVGEEALIAKTNMQAVKMVDVALAEGLNTEGAMRYERDAKGYHDNLSWWPQCETIIGCVNAWQITGDTKYLQVAKKNWNYVQQHFVDNTVGGWFKGLTDDGQPAQQPKVSMWNCPYHNSRVAFELSTRLELPRVHTEVMAWSNITGVRLEGELIDFESTLRVGTIGSDMESTGREKQQKIKYNREGNQQITLTPMHGVEVKQ